jgi:hypothetical protein
VCPVEEGLKVHVGLTSDLAQSLRSSTKAEALEKARSLSRQLHLDQPNLERALRFGILTGIAEPDAVESLRAAKEVDWVEIDAVRKAI